MNTATFTGVVAENPLGLNFITLGYSAGKEVALLYIDVFREAPNGKFLRDMRGGVPDPDTWPLWAEGADMVYRVKYLKLGTPIQVTGPLKKLKKVDKSTGEITYEVRLLLKDVRVLEGAEAALASPYLESAAAARQPEQKNLWQAAAEPAVGEGPAAQK